MLKIIRKIPCWTDPYHDAIDWVSPFRLLKPPKIVTSISKLLKKMERRYECDVAYIRDNRMGMYLGDWIYYKTNAKPLRGPSTLGYYMIIGKFHLITKLLKLDPNPFSFPKYRVVPSQWIPWQGQYGRNKPKEVGTVITAYLTTSETCTFSIYINGFVWAQSRQLPSKIIKKWDSLIELPYGDKDNFVTKINKRNSRLETQCVQKLKSMQLLTGKCFFTHLQNILPKHIVDIHFQCS